MTEVYFYHLQNQTLEAILPKLLLAGLARGWRSVVQTGSDERAEALAAALWIFDDESFLPHGTARDGAGELQPVWITAGDDTPNGAAVRFFVDGAAAGDIGNLTRAVIVFNGNDDEALERARADWRRFRGAGFPVSYWQQDENGKWQNRASAAGD